MSRPWFASSLFLLAALGGCGTNNNDGRWAHGDCNDSGCFGCTDAAHKSCWPLPYDPCGPNNQCNGGGVCTNIGCAASCHLATDCRQGEACTTDGYCAPGEAQTKPLKPGDPNPGRTGCVADAQCPAGQFCSNGQCGHAPSCGIPAALCTVTADCGTGRTCYQGGCHALCGTSGPCPTGQTCSSGTCLDLSPVKAACVLDYDCGPAYRCINAACHALCAASSQCPTWEFCDSGVCRADLRPTTSH